MPASTCERLTTDDSRPGSVIANLPILLAVQTRARAGSPASHGLLVDSWNMSTGEATRGIARAVDALRPNARS